MISEHDSKTKHASWWKRRTRLEKWLLLMIGALLLLLLLVLTLRIFRDYQKSQEICNTPSCIRAAVKVLSKVDLTVDPCKDFYNFSCGNFVKENVLPPYKTGINSFSIVSDMVDAQMQTLLEKPIESSDVKAYVIAKSLYQACMNTTEIEANALKDLQTLLKSLGGWPVVEGLHWKENSFDWLTTTLKFMKLGLNTEVFFQFYVAPNESDSSQYTLTLDQPYIVVFDKKMRKGFNESLIQAYYSYMVDIAKAFGAEDERARKQMRDVIDLDITITRITIPAEERRNSSLENNKMTIEQLYRSFNYVDWLQFINALLSPVKQLNYRDVITVTVPKYFKSLEHVILSIPKRTLANYIFWKAVKGLVPYLGNNVREIQLRFTKVMSGRTEREARWKECIQKTKRIHVASGALYVRNFFKKEAKNTMLELVNNIQNEFISMLQTVDWMDEVTRKHAIEKAKLITSHIAYPDELLEDTKIDEYYRNLTVDRLKYLDSFRNVSLFERQLEFLLLDKPTDKKDWKNHAYAAVTNAFYDQNENSIEFPASILQDVFFDNDRPQYMNYGAIGYIIGHEISHAFDDEGRQYDKDGNLVDWWEEKTKKAFDVKAQCIIDQYSNFTVPHIDINLNGINTQGENIADNGGIKQAYLAYQKWVSKHGVEKKLPGLPFTPEQMFWISAGNTWCNVERTENLKIIVTEKFHSPNYYRVNVPLMNSELFARDFNCPSGSFMNPVHKCSVW